MRALRSRTGYGRVTGRMGPSGNLRYQTYVEQVKALMGNALIALYPMDETSGTTAFDVSGNGLNGTYSNVSLGAFTGPTGQPAAGYASASSSYMDFYSPGFNTAFNGQEFGILVWTWVPVATNGGDIVRVAKDLNNYIKLTKNGSSLDARLYYTGGNTLIQTAAGNYAETNRWVPVCITGSKTNNRLRVYKGGTPMYIEVPIPITWTGSLSNSVISNFGVASFNGGLAYGMFFNREITPVEVAKLSQVPSDLSMLCGAFRCNSAAALTTPTYDLSGQATHPSVYDAGAGNTWNGYRYWMAMTPYPTANDDYENPSILASADGTTWVVPAGATNPLVPMPATGWNSDTELLMSPDNTTLYMFYREHQPAAGATIYAISTTDGVNWSAPVTVVANAYNQNVSPTVIHDAGVYKMWYVDHRASPYKLQYRTSNAPTSGYSAEQLCTVTNAPTGLDLWHIQTLYDTVTSKYYMLANFCTAGTSGANGELYLMYSDNGINWTCSTVPLLWRVMSAWDSKLYRACAVKVGDTYDLYYGGVSGANAWRIGRTTVTFTVSGVGKA